MIKKVIDIIPPKEKKKINKKKAKQLLPKSNFFGSKTNLYSDKKLSFKKPAFVLYVLILSGIFVYAYFTLPKAEIKILPRVEPLTAEVEVVIGKDITGKTLEFTETVNQFFPTQGRFLKETKARGVIRVYNNYSTTPVNLIRHTRFRSACGKEFRTPVAISIPGKRHDGRNWVPGSLDVEVIAIKPGNKFNIEPTAFSVPGLSGTALFTAITGRSDKSMTGGEISEIGKVTQEDLDLAKNLLVKRATDGCLDKLRDYQGFYISEELVDVSILESFANVGVGTKVREFNFQVKTSCRTIGFQKGAIRNFALDYLYNKINKEKLIVPESLKINYSLKNKDINQEKMTLSLVLTAETYLAIDKVAIENKLIGRSRASVRRALEGWSGINTVDVNFWPFWVESVPENLDRVDIKLKFD